MIESMTHQCSVGVLVQYSTSSTLKADNSTGIPCPHVRAIENVHEYYYKHKTWRTVSFYITAQHSIIPATVSYDGRAIRQAGDLP